MDLLSCTDSNTPLLSLKGTVTEAKVVAAHDGDTFKAAIGLNDCFVKVVCRVEGIDTPEIRPPARMKGRAEYVQRAHKARNRLVQLLTDADIDLETVYKDAEIVRRLNSNARVVVMRIGETDKYGRLLVSFPDIPVAETLINEGLACGYDGGSKIPI